MNGIELEKYHKDYESLKPQIQKHGWYNTPPSAKAAIIRNTLFLQAQKAPLWVRILCSVSDLATQAMERGSVTCSVIPKWPVGIVYNADMSPADTSHIKRKTIDRPWSINDPDEIGKFLRECLETACDINHVSVGVFRDDIDSLIANFVDLITPEPPASRTFKICDAYESGVGHGRQDVGATNPYSDPELKEAFELGYKKGKEIRDDHS